MDSGGSLFDVPPKFMISFINYVHYTKVDYYKLYDEVIASVIIGSATRIFS